MSFAEWLALSKTLALENLPITVGGGVAIVVLTLYLISSWRRRTPALAVNLATLHAAPPDKELNWAPPEQSYADRRGAVRREGSPVRVVLASPTFRNGVNDGFIIDRSTGGLKIAMKVAIAPGSALQVRAANAPDTIGFVTVLVRSCRKETDHFVVGSEFEKTPPWNVLLLFG